MEEWGFPGLVKVMEDRLGPIGRPLSTLLIVVVILGIFVWVGDLVNIKAVQPIANAFHVESVSVNLVEIVLIYGVGAIVWAAALTAVHVFVFARTNRKIEQLRAEVEANDRQYHSYMADLNAIAVELSQRGIFLKTLPLEASDPD